MRRLTRSRVQLQRLIGIIRNHIEGLLEEGGIKLTAVATDPLGVSGWAMLQLLAKGETDVKVLAAPLHPKVLQRKLGRLWKEFAKAGINAQAAMAQALASHVQGVHA